MALCDLPGRDWPYVKVIHSTHPTRCSKLGSDLAVAGALSSFKSLPFPAPPSPKPLHPSLRDWVTVINISEPVAILSFHKLVAGFQVTSAGGLLLEMSPMDLVLAG